MKTKKWKSRVIYLFIGVTVSLIGLPVLMVILGSLKSGNELRTGLAPILLNQDNYMKWHILPAYPTVAHYVKLLLHTPQFFVVFWNSLGMVTAILSGQIMIAIPAAWAFARFQFRGKKILFAGYIVLMMMPFQVMMLPNYLVLDALHLMNTSWAIILPGIFSAFPVFLIYRGFTQIPDTLIEAAKIDGADEIDIFKRIGMPLGSSGILSALVLGYLEYWNLVEQPLAFLQDRGKWPLSLYLPEIGLDFAGMALAASVMMLIPALLVFLMGQDYLEKGIVASTIKM